MKERIREIVRQSIDIKQEMCRQDVLVARMEEAAKRMVASLRDGGKVHFCGNGGSAADAQHLAAELSGRFYFDRPPLNAEALHCNSSYLTAIGNDYGFDEIYARLLRGTGRRGDVLVAISTSGNSQNILKVCATAKEMGILTIAFTGKSGGKLKEYADILINVPSDDTPRIQETHIMAGHIICELVEKEMFGK